MMEVSLTKKLLNTTVKYLTQFHLRYNSTKVVTDKGIKYRKVFYITVPVGTGIFGYNQWRINRKNQSATNFEVKCYCALPLRAISRWWGWMADIQIPRILRPYIYGLYVSTFGVNLVEAKISDLAAYPTLSEFFCRELKENVRQIDQSSHLVSPCDGIVLNCGQVENGVIEQVKGVNYDLFQFLGANGNSPESLLNNKQNKLYQCTIYLAPGDYHRFHSPADWQPVQRRHFAGELLSVNPEIARWIPDLFVLNERACYVGNWKYGFFSMTAVGATNVGNIRVYFDDNLTTNIRKHQKYCNIKHEFKEEKLLKKGDLFGEFRMGSTIVIIFEAPAEFQFKAKPRSKIYVGESLGHHETHTKPHQVHKVQQSEEIRSR